MRKTQEKIILYVRFCHMHDVKKFKMLTISLTTMRFSLQPAPAHLLSHGYTAFISAECFMKLFII
jgi:hypothetical protein